MGMTDASWLSRTGATNRTGDYYFFFPFFLSGVCVSADAATLLTAFGLLGFDRSFDALVATVFDVRSFLAMGGTLLNR